MNRHGGGQATGVNDCDEQISTSCSTLRPMLLYRNLGKVGGGSRGRGRDDHERISDG
jgi:hypothetical protein